MQLPGAGDMRGIDVSRWQGDIDWRAVRSAGIELCYIKATEGTTIIDPDFARNYEGARAAGIPVGMYHFMNALNETDARAQAEYFVRALDGRTYQARPVGDMPYGHNLSAERFTAICAAFLERVAELTGVTPMIYASAWVARARMLEPLGRYPLWVANYGVKRPEDARLWSEWTGFQRSETGRVAGIASRVDLDWFTRGALTGDTDAPKPQEPAKSDHASGVIYYIVRRGDALSRIARRYGVTVQELVGWNGISNPNRIYPGEVLRIFSPRDVVPRGGEVLHVVSQGETLSGIAQEYGVTLGALMSANDIANPNRIYPGEVLHIPAAGLLPHPTTAPWPLDNTCVVQPGETLSGIGARYGVPWRQLARDNGIANPDRIYPGQVLKLYAAPLGGNARAFTGYCVAQPGDTMARIAQRYGASAAGLRADNALTAPNEPAPGRVLRVQPEAGTRGEMI